MFVRFLNWLCGLVHGGYEIDVSKRPPAWFLGNEHLAKQATAAHNLFKEQQSKGRCGNCGCGDTRNPDRAGSCVSRAKRRRSKPSGKGPGGVDIFTAAAAASSISSSSGSSGCDD